MSIKTTRTTFLITDKQIQMRDAIKDKLGVLTDTDVYRTAISMLYDKLFKYGQDPIAEMSSNDNMSSDERYIKKQELKEVAKVKAKKAVEYEKLAEKRQICEIDWGGKVDGNDCVYQQYGWGEKTELKIPLKMITKEIAERNVFMQDIRVVAKTFPEVKEKFAKLLASKE